MELAWVTHIGALISGSAHAAGGGSQNQSKRSVSSAGSTFVNLTELKNTSGNGSNLATSKGGRLLKLIQPCGDCVGYGWGNDGYVPASGTGDNGVLVIAEAAGREEADSGTPLVGAAGQYLWSQLKRVGITRDGFRIHNVLSCRPPDNKLAKMPYESLAINSCAPLLDQTIVAHREHTKAVGKHPVIVTLGKIAFKRVMGLQEWSPMMKEDYIGYAHWNQVYQSWVFAADHPSYLMRGYHHLVPILQFTFQRALDVARDGLARPVEDYLLDPTPQEFSDWVTSFEAAYEKDGSLVLSYDIETPFKEGADEEDVSKEQDADQTILRCSFAYKGGRTTSVRWASEHTAALRRLFGSPAAKLGWNSQNYDYPRVVRQMPVAGDQLDAMLAWHVLNSTMPKGLGFVTPFYWQSTAMWKHLSAAEPAYYNAKDAQAALVCWEGISEGLKKERLWPVFERHVIQLNRVFSYMSNQGVQRDESLRLEAEIKLVDLLSKVDERMQSVVPVTARRLKTYKKTPKVTAGMIQVPGKVSTTQCPGCGTTGVKAAHFKSIGKKKLKAGLSENSCLGLKATKIDLDGQVWAQPLPFKVSKKGLELYQASQRHRPIWNKKENRITFDEPAIYRLMKQYPADTLYPLILENREYQKLLSTYVGQLQPDGTVRGGLPVGSDGLIRTLFTHNPSTLRSASQNPNLQNLPRPGGKDDLQTIVRNLILARPGSTFIARDYSGIEAVLVGYEAKDPGYLRLAKQDVHSFYTVYALRELGDPRVSQNDLPDISWPDSRLFPHLAELKTRFKAERNALYKHLVHGANFMQGAMGARDKIFAETRVEYPVALVQKVMDIYFALFPKIKAWHTELLYQAERDGYLRNAFGYVHRFSRVFEYENVYGSWVKEPGPEANKVIAFLPQSTAAGIIKEAMLRLYFSRFEEAGQYLRLLVHDELLSEVPLHLAHEVDEVFRTEMEKPIPQLPLDPEWKMGDFLVVNTEAKSPNIRWGSMK